MVIITDLSSIKTRRTSERLEDMGRRKRQKEQANELNNAKESDNGKKSSNVGGSKQKNPTTSQTQSEADVNKENLSHPNNAGEDNVEKKEKNKSTQDVEHHSSEKKTEKKNSTQDAEHGSTKEELQNQYLRRQSPDKQDYRDDPDFRDGHNYYGRSRRDVGASQDERGRRYSCDRYQRDGRCSRDYRDGRDYRDARDSRDRRDYRDGWDYRDGRDYRNGQDYRYRRSFEGSDARYVRNDHRPSYNNRRPYDRGNRYNDRRNLYDDSRFNFQRKEYVTINDRKDQGNEAVPNTTSTTSTALERNTQLEKKVGQVEKTVSSMYQMMKYGAHQPLIPLQMHHPAIPTPTVPASAPTYIALIPPSSLSQPQYGPLQLPAEAHQMQLNPTLGSSVFHYANSALGRSALTPYQHELLRHNFI